MAVAVRTPIEVICATVLNVVVSGEISQAWMNNKVDSTVAMTGLLLLAGVDVIGRWRVGKGKEPLPGTASLLVLAGVYGVSAGEVTHAIAAALHRLAVFV